MDGYGMQSTWRDSDRLAAGTETDERAARKAYATQHVGQLGAKAHFVLCHLVPQSNYWRLPARGRM